MTRWTEVDLAKLVRGRPGQMIQCQGNTIAVGTLTFSLPWPPSANNLYPTIAGKRRKSRAAKAFSKAAGEELVIQCVPKRAMLGKYLAVTLDLCPPIGARPFDIDNRAKAVLDALQAHAIIENDKHVHELHIHRWAPQTKAGGVLVRLRDLCYPPQEIVHG